MPVGLHPEAKQRFDEVAEALVQQLSTTRPTRSAPEGFRAHGYIPDEVVTSGDLTEESVDLVGDQGYLVTTNKEGSLGLYGTHYTELHKLAEAVQRTKALESALSIRFVRDEIFSWLKERFNNRTQEPMTTSLLSAANRSIAKYDVWIPVSFLYIQSSFSVGQITFQTFTESIFQTWVEQQRPDMTEAERRTYLAWIDRTRKALQGTAAATMNVTAEPQRAIERALDLADVSVGILRLYAPANYRADEISYCALQGTAHRDSQHAYILDGSRLVFAEKGEVDLNLPHWLIRNEDLADFRAMGLDGWSQVAAKAERTSFEEDVLNALLLYTRGALKNELADRLVYQFAGLESLLVADEQEGLVQNIRERLAFALETDPSKRAEIIKAVNLAYQLRSGFVHHGRPVADRGTFEEFAQHGWRLFNMLAHRLHFATRADFIKAIEQIKLS